MALDLTVKLAKLLEQWDTATPPLIGDGLIQVLTEIAEVFEAATELYLKKDPDPFDGRHPSRAHPDSAIGHMLKKVFSHQTFIESVLNDYLSEASHDDVKTVACRILLDILPGMDPQIFRENERVVRNLILWTERSSNPLQSYSVGVLAVAMDDESIALNFIDENTCLVPVLIERLTDLNVEYFKTKHSPKKEKEIYKNSSVERPFAHLSNGADNNTNTVQFGSPRLENNVSSPYQCNGDFNSTNTSSTILISECSNSSWTDMEPLMIGAYFYQVYPLTLANAQRYILQYLTSVGVYQELLTSILEDPVKILQLVCSYFIDLKQHSNIRLAFDALRYLGVLLCHKKCSAEFISKIGIHELLQVHRPSLAATGVAFVVYNLANNEDAMQKIYLLEPAVVGNLVSYALWLLECSHSSGRAYATMFFEYVFIFDSLRIEFHEQDGLRKLFNTVSTLDIVVRNLHRPVPGVMSQDVVTSRHVCRHAIVALKKYFEAYLDCKASALRRTKPSTSRSLTYKKTLEENVEAIVSLSPRPITVEPIEQFLKLDGIHFLLKLIVIHNEWSYSGKLETVRNALDILFACSVSDKVKLSICDTIQYNTSSQTVSQKIGMKIILQCALGEKVSDCDVRRSALNVIVNCVACPLITEEDSDGIMGNPSLQPSPLICNTDVLKKVWNTVQSSNGIMILKMLLTIKSPVSSADAIRALACQALCGLARYPEVMQIVSKLQLLTSGQLQVLMKQPVLRDKRQEHAKFVKYCTKLLEMVAGGSVHGSQMASINKAEIVAQTVITYDERQLLWLISSHLKEKGLTNCANILIADAGLSKPDVASRKEDKKTFLSSTPFNKQIDSPRPAKRICIESLETSSPKTPRESAKNDKSVNAIGTPSRRILHPKAKKSSTSHDKHFATPSPYTPKSKPVCEFLSKEKPQVMPIPRPHCAPAISLSSIVSEYLRSQHGMCKNPYVTCPPFDLFKPHQCPEPQFQNIAPRNIALRCMQKQYTVGYWARIGSSMTRKFMSSRFRDVMSFMDPYGNSMTQSAFSSLHGTVYVGTFNGDLTVYDIASGNVVHSYSCHETEVTNIQPLKKSNLVMTSAQWRRPVTALWDASKQYELKHIFQDECYAEFSKFSNTRIIATKYDRAQIYDLATGQLITTLSQCNSNSYRLNRATFNYSDELVLSDGVIWDVKHTSRPIHKLDKFNPRINGIFHPNGLEILSNSEIWDMRTYRLLRTVPELEQSKLIFDSTGDVLYGAILAPEIDHDSSCFKRYGSSFRSFDGADYACITTKDVQKGINDIAINSDDRYLSVIQSPLAEPLFGNAESKCHIYEVGRGYEDDDMDGMNEEEEEDSHQGESDDEDDDDQDDDDDDDDNDDDDQDVEDDGPDIDDELEQALDDEDDDANSDDSYSGSDEELYFSFRA